MINRNLSTLRTLFIALLILRIGRVGNFADIHYWQIALLLVLDLLYKYLRKLWNYLKFDRIVESQIDAINYDIRLNREIKKAKKQIEKDYKTNNLFNKK